MSDDTFLLDDHFLDDPFLLDKMFILKDNLDDLCENDVFTSDSTVSCAISGCNSPIFYQLNWRALNEHGKAGIVLEKRHYCSDVLHLMEGYESAAKNYGGHPDKILDLYSRVHEKLLVFASNFLKNPHDEKNFEKLVQESELHYRAFSEISKAG